jgi:hypothetical protein
MKTMVVGYDGEGCQNDVHSCCGSVVLVHEAAEPVAAVDMAVPREHRRVRLRRMERESAVGALVVVVLDVGAQDVFEVAAANDQEPVRAFVADGADESFRVGVRLRRLHWRVDDPVSLAAEYLVEGGGELAVPIVDQETDPLKQVGEAEVARLLDDPGSGWVRRAAGEVDAPAAELDEDNT